MDQDISGILEDWPYEPEGNVRRITGRDGREKVQIRVRVDTYHGILQFDCDGRPDGRQIRGHPFALDYFEELLREHAAGDDADEPFALTHKQAEEICREGVMIYHRYVVLLQLGDHDRVIRDTMRNMRLFRFVADHAEHEEDRQRLEKWWPYIIRIHHTASALKSIHRGDFDRALAAIKEARQRIDELPEQDDEVFHHERERSLSALDELARQIDRQRPLSPVEELEKRKEQALAREDYEEAARLRDEIGGLGRHPDGQ